MIDRTRLSTAVVPTPAECGRAVLRATLGDRTGATIFLIALAWFGLFWRLGFFSTDELTFANAIRGVTDGHLHIAEAAYGPASGETPGTYLVDGRVYGRNYGVIVLSAGALLALQGAATAFDLRILLLGAWLLTVVGAAAGVGRWLDRPNQGARVGTAAAVVLLAANLPFATPLSPRWYPLLALQLTTAVAAGLVGVTLYRLAGRMFSRRVAVFAGLVTVLGTPVGFWASIPKRHSVTALLVVLALYTLYRSREAADRRSATRFRALTYAWCGFAAWVHAGEGLILLLAVATIDLPTARWNRPGDVALVGLALLVSLLPFFVTNALISGNPLHPPRLLPGYDGGALGADAGGTPAGEPEAPPPAAGGGETSSSADEPGGAAAPADDGSDGTATIDPITAITSAAALGVGVLHAAVDRLGTQFQGSFGVLATEPGRAVTIFVRTGYVSSVRASEDVAVNLSVLSSMPLLGAVVAMPILAGRVLATRAPPATLRPRRWEPRRVVDALAILYVILLMGLFLRQLPVHHMLTVRYLHPLYAIGVYGLVRLPIVRRAVDGHAHVVAGAFAATLFVGSALYLGTISRLHLTLGEAVQLYALCALAVAAAVAGWTISGIATGRFERAGAAVLGLGAGITAVYLLVSGLALFPVTGEFLLPIARPIAESIHYARLFGSTPPF